MYCRNCGLEIDDKASLCPHCGIQTNKGVQFCQSCGKTTQPTDRDCIYCKSKLAGAGKDWLTTLLLNVFLGYLGVHRFYTGNIGIGIGQLLTLGGCGIWSFIDLMIIITDNYKDGDGQALEKNN